MITEIIENKLKITREEQDICVPLFFRLQHDTDKKELEALLSARPQIKVFDTITSQLKELVKSEHPSVTFSKDEIDTRIAGKLNGRDAIEYGVWVYYPWNDKLVHILDEQEFVFLRTNRNKYKITDEEEALLATKTVGVVGLSVGQAVSITLAMERTVGELRIADHDELEITNLNRLRSGVHNMGLKKTVQVARDIAEIDPYLKVTIYSDGLTEANMDDFFTRGGKLDVIIDECDGLDMKILLRHKAKAMGIPVLMEASDRGTVDVERFDLEPDRPILHGFIDHLDHTKIGNLTNDEKIPYIMPMLGIDTISKRLKASMAEIKQTISTWPQLASAVALGGALCADICRRILLDKYHESGRYFVDIEELIGDKEAKMEGVYDTEELSYPALTTTDMLGIISSVPEVPSDITSDALLEIVAAGVDAPSAANNQPWKFLTRNNILYLFHDRQQSCSWTDKDDFIARIALGAALENMTLKASALGYQPDARVFPLGPGSPLVAAISFSPTKEKPEEAALSAYIGQRCTNRRNGDRSPVPAEILTELATTCSSMAGCELVFRTDQEQVNAFADIESAAERIRFLHPQSHMEFFGKELKWNEDGKRHIPEGLDIKTFELSVSDEMGLRVASDPGVIALLNQWRTGKAFEKQIRNSIRSASAVGLVTVPRFDPYDILQGGRAVERTWLNATQYHLSLQPMSAPLFLYSRIKYCDTLGATENMINEINDLYEKLSILFPELHNRHGLFLFRLFKAEPPTARSLRKHIDELYTIA